MAERLSLREFQEHLAERLRGASGGEGSRAKLGFLAGGQQWLVDLNQVNEVVTVNQITPVPWTLPWFLGMASVRGALFGCADLAVYQGLPCTANKGEFRLLLAHPRFGVNAALRIDRAVGLRNVDSMTATDGQDDKSWLVARWQDVDGSHWNELNMEKLVSSTHFLAVGL